MRQTRLTKKRRRQMKRNLYIKPLVTVYIAFLLLALTVDGTAAKFNDITSVEGAFQVGEWTPDIPDDEEDWDHSSLTFVKGVKGDCEKITATVKNTGDDMKSPWKYHVHRKAKSDWPRVEGFEGEIELIENKDTVEVSFTPEQNGMYRFEFVRPEGYQGNKGGKSGVIKLKDCEEKQSGNSEDHNGKKNNKDERHKDKKENNNGNGQKNKGNKSEQNENKGSSNQENNEEQVEEDKESKQDNGNNQENEQKSEQDSKDQESKDEATKEKSEDFTEDNPDDKKEQKKKQPSTKNDQQQESKQEKETAETDSNDDKQQDNQTTKSQDSKDDDTQVKKDESSKGAQNEKE